jgi:predicted GTPase
MADIVVFNKVGTAPKAGLRTVLANVATCNPRARVIEANSPITIDHPKVIKGKKVLVVEDGPTLTHGGMTYGAGTVAARQAHVKQVVDPRPWAVGTIKAAYAEYPGIGSLLPAMGYTPKQVKDLQRTINACPVDAVIIATPIDLRHLFEIDKPTVRVTYELSELEPGGLKRALGPIITA